MDDYLYLNTGEKIQKYDEYSTNNSVWTVVPDFLVGDTVIESSHTKWRRKKEHKEIQKKKWFKFW